MFDCAPFSLLYTLCRTENWSPFHSVVFLTGERSLMVNHRLWRIEEMLTEHPNFVRINRSEIVNLDVIDGFEGNCYYIGKNPLYATGVYRQRMEGVFIKAKQQ